jgi:hypothetical protein
MNARAFAVALVFLVAVGGLAWIPTPTFARFFLLCGACVIVYAAIVFAFIGEARRAVLARLTRRAG